MSDTKKICKLCGLPVKKPIFTLKTKDGELVFCCGGCKCIYQMLHGNQVLPKSK